MKTLFKKLPWLVLIPFGLLLPKLLSNDPAGLEQWFGQKAYPVISEALSTIFGIVPFSIAEWLLYALVLFIVLRLLFQLIRLLTFKIRISCFLNTLLSILIAAGCMLVLFYVTWGCNYFRPNTASLLGMTISPRSKEELKLMCASLAKDATALRSRVSEDEDGVFVLPEGYQACFEKIPDAFHALSDTQPILKRKTVPAAKGVLLGSKGLSYAGISGIYIPFTAEANVNIDQPPLLLLSSAAHETAHYLGIAHEDGANFVGYLACIRSEDPAIRYSGTMLALIHSTNKLAAMDEDAYREVYSYYSEGMRRDLLDYSEYWDQFEGTVEETVTKVNDAYLKHNRQESGVQSYGEMVDLLLAYYFA